MAKPRILAALGLVLLVGCKTTGSSGAKSFEINGSASAANQKIVATVISAFPDTAAHQDVLVQFATQLQNSDSAGAKSPAELLQAYYSAAQAPSGTETDFDNYVVQEFCGLTNYIAARANGGPALQYIGPTVGSNLGK